LEDKDYLDEEEDNDDESKDFVDQEWQNWDDQDELIPNPGNVKHQDLEEEELQPQPKQPPTAEAQAPAAPAEEAQAPTTTRSRRITCPPTWHNEYQAHMQTQAHPSSMTMEYTLTDARVIAMLFQYLEEKSYRSNDEFWYG